MTKLTATTRTAHGQPLISQDNINRDWKHNRYSGSGVPQPGNPTDQYGPDLFVPRTRYAGKWPISCRWTITVIRESLVLRCDPGHRTLMYDDRTCVLQRIEVVVLITVCSRHGIITGVWSSLMKYKLILLLTIIKCRPKDSFHVVLLQNINPFNMF